MSTSYASPVQGSGGTPGSYPVFSSHSAILTIRCLQLFIAFIILVLGGILMHGLVMGQIVFSFVCGILTLASALYALLSEKVAGCRAGYNYWAIVSLDGLLIVFWLASMGAVAALRASFRYETNAECYDDGSAVNAGYCVIDRRELGGGGAVVKRAAVATTVGLAEMSAIAGLSALELIFFVITFAYLAHQVRTHRRNEQNGVFSSDAAVAESKIAQGEVSTGTYAGGQAYPLQSQIFPAQGYDNSAAASAPKQYATSTTQSYPMQPYPSQTYPVQNLTPGPSASPAPAPVSPLQQQYDYAAQQAPKEILQQPAQYYTQPGTPQGQQHYYPPQ